TRGQDLVECPDTASFKQVAYGGPKTSYQRLMRAGMGDDLAPNSMRLANQRPETVARLRKILATCRKGVRMSSDERISFGIGKESITPLDPARPAKTLTSLPDDFV